MDSVDKLNARLKALIELPEGRTLEEDNRIDEGIEAMVTSPENQAILDRILDAEEEGDKDEVARLEKLFIWSPDTFVSNMLQKGGRERLIRKGYRLDTVEMKYGKGWLDREYPRLS